MIRLIKKIFCAMKQFFLNYKVSRVAVMLLAAVLAVGCLVAAAHPVTIMDGDSVMTVNGYHNESSALLAEAGISLGDHDSVETDEAGNLVIVRRFPITLIDGASVRTVYTEGGTVADLLTEEKITCGEYDELNYTANTELFKNMRLELKRVEYVYAENTVSIPRGSRTVYSSGLWSGTKKVSQGSDGQKLVTSRIKMVNGEATDESTVVNEKILENPVDDVVTVGTKTNGSWVSHLTPSKPIELDAAGAPMYYSKLVTGIASAYSPIDGRSSATGVYLEAGYVAVNPKVIPYGSKLYIRTTDGSVIYGYAIAADTGGFVHMFPDRVVDLFFESEAAAEQFGLRNIQIYVLE